MSGEGKRATMPRPIKLFVLSVTLIFLVSCGSKEISKAKQYIEAGMYDQAIELLKMEIGSNPQNAEAHFVLGKCYLLREAPGAANESFERAMLLKPKYRDRIAGAYVDGAMKYLDQKDLDAAMRYLGLAVETNFLSMEIAMRILIETVKQWPPEPAQVSYLRQLFQLISMDAPQIQHEAGSACLEIAEKYVDSKMYEEAGELLGRAANLNPGNAEKVAKLCYEMGANILNSLGDWQKAIRLLNACTKYSSRMRGLVADLCFDAAGRYYNNQQRDAAYVLVNKSKDLDPKYIEKAKAFIEKTRGRGNRPSSSRPARSPDSPFSYGL